MSRGQIVNQYISSLGRAPSTAELDYWEGVASSGAGTGAVLNAIAISNEAQARGGTAPAAAPAAAELIPFGQGYYQDPATGAVYSSKEVQAVNASKQVYDSVSGNYITTPATVYVPTAAAVNLRANSNVSSSEYEIWKSLAAKAGIAPQIDVNLGLGSEGEQRSQSVINPDFNAFVADMRSKGIDVNTTKVPGYQYEYSGTITKNGSPISEPIRFTSGEGWASSVGGAIKDLAPIALAAITSSYLSSAAGAGAGGAGAGGAGFLGLESELAGLAAAEAGMGGLAGAALPGIEAALAGGAAGTAGYLAGAAGAGAAGAGAAGAGAAGAGAAGSIGSQLANAAAGAAAGQVPWGQIIGTIASLYGGSQAAGATKDAAQVQAEAYARAADLQLQAQREALALQERMYREGVARQEPWLQAGQNALARLQGQTNAMPEAFQYRPEQLTTDPGYGFRFSEGLKALERSAAARGGLLSGGTGKALTRYGQEMASQEYGNAYNRALTEYNSLRQREAEGYNRLAGIAGVGGTTAQQLSAAGQQYGQQTGNLLTNTAANLGNLASQSGSAAANALLTGAALRQSAYGDIGNIWGKYLGGGF